MVRMRALSIIFFLVSVIALTPTPLPAAPLAQAGWQLYYGIDFNAWSDLTGWNVDYAGNTNNVRVENGYLHLEQPWSTI